ncbi:MAG: HlyD family efflux transporter periplasmic adaptor subunit [Acidobacteriota bacterium]
MDVLRTDSATTRRKRLAIRLLAVLSLAIIGGVAFSRQRPAAPTMSRSQVWIDTVRRGALNIEVRGSGVLTPEDLQWIAAATDGRIERIMVLPGSAVTADSVLLEIQNPELQQAALDASLQLRAAEAELHNRRNQVESALLTQEAVAAGAQADHEEARLRAASDEELMKAGLLPPLTLTLSRGREAQFALRVGVERRRLDLARASRSTEVAAAQARVDQLKALVHLKEEQREALHVRAGRAGIVQQVAVEAGQRVVGGAVLALVAAPHPLKAVVQVAEGQARDIARGQRADVDTHNGVIAGAVSRIDPAVRNGSVTIDIALPRDLPAGCRPDLSVDAAISLARLSNTVFVGRPVQADANGTVRLFKVAPDQRSAALVTVRVGRVSFNSMEILSGLVPGDRVVLSDTSAFDGFDRLKLTD